MAVYKSITNLLFELRETDNPKEKEAIYHNYIYGNKTKIDYIYSQNWDYYPINEKKKKTYHVNELVNPFKKISNYQLLSINNIFQSIFLNKKPYLNKYNKDTLVNLFGINKSSEIINANYFYNICEPLLDFNRKEEDFKLSFDLNKASEFYISLSLPKKKVDYLESIGITKLSDLNNVMLNQIEIDNINNYYSDLFRYEVNDRLMISIIPKEYRNVVITYFKEGTFNKTAKVLNLSVTKTRLTFYSAVKRVIDYFSSASGIRALWIIFSSNNRYLLESDLERLFPVYCELLKWMFKKELIYNIIYDNKTNRFVCIDEEKNMIKLVGFDLDDTLLNSKKEIQDIDAVKELIDSGVKICFCSGRPYVPKIKKYYEVLGLKDNLYYVAFNGVAVYNLNNDESIYGDYLSEEEVIKIADIVNKEIKKNFGKEDFGMYSYRIDNTVETTMLNEYVLLEKKFNDAVITVNDFWIKPVRSHKIMIGGKPELIKKLFNNIKEKLQDSFEALISMPCYIEVFKKNNDKYKGLLKVANSYGIKEDEIMTFGDSLNDLSLVRNGAIGIAMGNSVKEVKDVATFVTSDNDHYGVTKALIKYGLIKKI